MSKRPRRNRRLAFKARVASSPAGTRATWKITSDAPFRGEAAPGRTQRATNSSVSHDVLWQD